MTVGDGGDPFGHGESRAGGDGFNPETLGHREAVFNVLILHVVVHVVAEQRDIDAGVVELVAHTLPGGGACRRAPVADLLLLGLPGRLLLWSSCRAAPAAASRSG